LQVDEIRRDTVTCFSKALDKHIEIEKGLLHPIVSGTDVKVFAPLPNRQFIVFPYHVRDGQADLIPFSSIKNEYKMTADYLAKNRSRLEKREGGKFADAEWYRFGRSQNLGIQNKVKLCVPRLVDHLHAGIDLDGTHYLDNVDVGGVTWKPKCASRSLRTLLALLNSQVLRWYFPHVSAPFRGGFRSANRQFLEQLPICDTTNDQELQVDRIVDYLLIFNSHFAEYPDAQTTRDPLMLAYFEQILNGLVYELYFPGEVHGAGLRLFDLVEEVSLPDIKSIPEAKRLATLRPLFEALYDGTYPLKIALQKLQTLDTVRIIEGRA
jgi:hypothetical protein